MCSLIPDNKIFFSYFDYKTTHNYGFEMAVRECINFLVVLSVNAGLPSQDHNYCSLFKTSRFCTAVRLCRHHRLMILKCGKNQQMENDTKVSSSPMFLPCFATNCTTTKNEKRVGQSQIVNIISLASCFVIVSW